MGKYKIGVQESYYTVFTVDNKSYEDAIDEIENKIDTGEIILDDATSYKRTYRNDNSKFLKEKINLNLLYDPKKNILSISDGNKNADYLCFDVADIIRSFTYFCNSFIEDREITEEKLNKSELGGIMKKEFEKVDAKIIGVDGNVFNLIGICQKALRKEGYENEAKELYERVTSSGSYDEALQIMMEYVNPQSVKEESLDI